MESKVFIPKVIHYCWFGKTKKSKLINECILSWKKYLPDYQIKEWNEKNSDLSHHFVKEAYKSKKWAFVSDYIRLQKLYEFGGIYLDTDMMALKKIDIFLENDCFFGAEDLNLISAGIIGSIAKNEFIKKCLMYYDSIAFDVNKVTTITIPSIVTKIFREVNTYNKSFECIVTLGNVKIYPLEFFYPISFYERHDINNYINYIQPNTYMVHLWSSSWFEYSEFHDIRNREYLKGFKKVRDKIIKERRIEMKYIIKIASCIKQSLT